MVETNVVVIGGGFAGLSAVKRLRKSPVRITLIDRRNHHLFQPLLYQVAMAGLSPADIATPIRHVLSRQENVRVICSEVTSILPDENRLTTTNGDIEFDYLLVACGAVHSYFGNNDWEQHAPGLKTIEQATEIRRRVLSAFEKAELAANPEEQKKQLTFVVVGGGPTGVELAGAIGEMSRFTLSRDFRNIDPKLARIILIEAGPRVLPMFAEELSSRATRDLESLGVQTWTNSRVTNIDPEGVAISGERISAATVLWAAGIKAANIGNDSGLECDSAGRIIVQPDLSIPGFPNVFVAGDQCAFLDDATGQQLPGVAPVAVQQGRFVADTIRNSINQKPRKGFHYRDKGQMATIGRSRAITQVGKRKFTGFFAWLVWLVVHIYFLTGFRNRLFVFLSWAWSFFTFRRGARLIIDKHWRSYPDEQPRNNRPTD